MKQMLYEKEFVRIGQIRRAHGYKGHAKVHIEDMYMADLREQRFVFIEEDGYHVPFEIEELSEQRDVLLKIVDISNSEELNRYHLSELYLLKEDLKHAQEQIEEEELYHQLAGMVIYDSTSDQRVTIDRVEDYPSQVMAIVKVDDAERLIPLHRDLIDEMDTDAGVIRMTLPEGLLD